MQYGVHIAEIVGIAGDNNFRMKVRVLPHMSEISDDYLPIWPNFFKGKGITGKVGELVWCLTNEEFTMGYILGMVAAYTYSGSYADDSIPKTLLDRLDDIQVDLSGKLLNYRNIEVTFWNQTSVHFVERETGTSIIAFATGSLHIMKDEEFMVAIGDGKSETTSMIKMTADEIVFSSKNIRLQGSIKLGNNPQGKVLVTPGVLGRNGLPATDVWA